LLKLIKLEVIFRKGWVHNGRPFYFIEQRATSQVCAGVRYLICQNILGKGKEGQNKRGDGKGNLTWHGKLFYG